jgi:hypothetical protein
VIFNPLTPNLVIVTEPWLTQGSAYWRYFLWSAYYANLVLFLFNMLVVMFPMDAGRVLQELLWGRIGYTRAMRAAVTVGLLTAVGLGALALVAGMTQLLAVAVFGGFVCFNERRRLEFSQEPEMYEVGTPAGYGYGPRPPARGEVTAQRRAAAAEDRKYRAALKRQQEEAAAQVEVDRILAKISASGMGSLTRSERATLERASESKRGER